MKKLLIPLLILFASCLSVASAQTVHHHSYTTYYNASIKEPDSVVWDLTPGMCACAPQVRKDAFHADPQIPGSATPSDYTNSGYDKGHLFSYDDAQCNGADKAECFYMSNMLPQIHPFNAGDWKVLEMQERVWARSQKLHIVAGGYGYLGKLKNGEIIPAFMWKAIYMNGQYTVWIMPNQKTSAGHGVNKWKTGLHKFDLQSIGAEIARLKL